MVQTPLNHCVSRPIRIDGYDLARGLAVFGMLLVNFRDVMDAYENCSRLSSLTMGLICGRSAALFIILAGVGLALFCGQARRIQDPFKLHENRKTILKRSGILFAAGMLFFSVWHADILHFYGVYLGVAAFLLNSRDRSLWTLMGICILASALFVLSFGYQGGWGKYVLGHGGIEEFFCNLFFNGQHPIFPWMAFLILGLWLGRQNITDPTFQRNTLLAGSAMFLISELTALALHQSFAEKLIDAGFENIADLFTTGVLPPSPLYVISAAGTALVAIVLCIRLAQKNYSWLKPIIVTGRFSLTIYISHVLLGMKILAGLNMLHKGSPFYLALAYALLFYLGAVTFCVLWQKRYVRGPFETVMRWAAQ